MKHAIHGVLYHITDITPNKFLVAGNRYRDQARIPGRDVIVFSLVDPSRVGPVVLSLPDVEYAVVEWLDDEVIGLLRRHLKPPQNTDEVPANTEAEGQERTLRIQDLLRDLSWDRDIPQSVVESTADIGEENEPEFREARSRPPLPTPTAEIGNGYTLSR